MSDPAGTAYQKLGPFTRRPFVPVAILFAIGILLHESVAVRPCWLIITAAGLIAFSLLCVRRRIICSLLIATAIGTLGIAAARLEHFQFSSDDIGQFADDEPHLTELELHLPDEPELLAMPAGQRELPPKQVAIAEVLRIKTWGGWVDATGRLPIQIDQPNPSLAAGQTIRALGMLQRPRSAANPGEFDWAAYYRQQRILATFTITRSGNCKILTDPGPSPIGWLRLKTRHLLAMGFTQPHALDHALLESLVLGERDPLLRDVENDLQQTGTRYQLSVSGIHIAFLAWPILLLCRWMRLRPRWTLVIGVAFVGLCCLVSFPSHSGIRAGISAAVIGLCYLNGRGVDRWQLLAIGALVMLLWHPMDLLTVGFHLSFVQVTFGLMLLRRWQEWDWQHRDPDKAALRQHPTAMQKIRQQAISLCLRVLQYSLVAWVAALPLVAYYFGDLAAFAIPIGFIVLPFVLLAIWAGAAKILLTLLWPIAAVRWAVLTGWSAELMRWLVRQLAGWSGNHVALAAPPIWLIIVYYLLLLVPLLPELRWFQGRRRWILQSVPAIGIVAVLWSPLPRTTTTAAVPDDLRLTLLSVGAGQCAVVELPGETVDIFDAGSSTITDVSRKVVEPFLRAENRHQIDDIFLSHGDYDHISAAGDLAEIYHAHHVLTSYHFRRNAEGNIPDQLLLEQLDRLNLTPRQIATGDHFDLGSGVAVDCIWPPKTGDLNSNNAGLVLRLTYAGRSILFPADIQDPAFSGLLQHPAVLKSDVLVAPHHGSSEDLTPAFLAAVRPDFIISSNAGRLTNKQKRFDTMAGKTPLYRTSEFGSITVTISRDGRITITTFLKKPMSKATEAVGMPEKSRAANATP